MNIVICDDEENIRSYIRELIERQNIHCHVTEFSSGKSLLRSQEEKPPMPIDILFLDISIGDLDGMTVARRLKNQKELRQEAVWGNLPLLIFVTGYTEYMPEAFSVHAFQYIVKPIKENEFQKIFAQALREYHYLSSEKQKEPKVILVKSGNVTRKIQLNDIYYVEGSNRKVIISLSDEKIEYYAKISELESELGDSFFRIHKGYLIHMKYVKQYDRMQLKMKNGDCLPISKYKYQDFVKAYLEYILEG